MPRKRDPKIMAIVAANIRRFREEKGWSQEELRKRVRWKSKTMVSQLENRQTGVGPQTLRKLAKVFEKDPSEFFRGTPQIESPEGRKLISLTLTELGHEEDHSPADRQYPDTVDLENKTTFPLGSLVREPSEIYETHKKIFLPKWPVGREKHDLIWAYVDDEPPTTLLEIGDIICIDRDDQPVPGQTSPSDVYAVRLERNVMICRLEIRGHLLTLHDVYRYVSRQEPAPEEPITIDLRAHPSAIIGRVLWVLKPL